MTPAMRGAFAACPHPYLPPRAGEGEERVSNSRFEAFGRACFTPKAEGPRNARAIAALPPSRPSPAGGGRGRAGVEPGVRRLCVRMIDSKCRRPARCAGFCGLPPSRPSSAGGGRGRTGVEPGVRSLLARMLHSKSRRPTQCAGLLLLNGAPYGIRTRVLALRGPRPGPLDEGSIGIGERRDRTKRSGGPGRLLVYPVTRPDGHVVRPVSRSQS